MLECRIKRVILSGRAGAWNKLYSRPLSRPVRSEPLFWFSSGIIWERRSDSPDVSSASDLGFLAAQFHSARGALADTASYLVVFIAGSLPRTFDRGAAISGASGHGCLLVYQQL
jgi:hypothetical protein